MASDYHLHTLDIAALLFSLLIIILITIYSARRAKDTESYFLVGRNAPGWAVGVSFIATSVSSLTFLAFPAAAYAGNWTGVVPFWVIPFVAIIADRVCLPIYRRANVISGYEYLERRFNPFVRLYSSMMFLLLQFARVGLILVLFSMPLKLLTNLSQTNAILLCGLLTTTYVLFGGFNAVLWTDVIQTIILSLGGLFCVGVMVWDLPGGLSTIIDVGREADKFALPPLHVTGQLSWADFTHLTLIVLILHGIFNQLLYYSADQNVIQRYLAPSSKTQSRIALWVGSLGVVPTFTFFTFLGTCLYGYYVKLADPAVASLQPEQVFPHFILTRLPRGIVGLIISAVIAAAMSSVDSNLNAIALVFQIDIYERHIVKNRSDRHYLRVAKITTLIGGLAMTLSALALTKVNAETILDLMFLVYAIFAGGLAGIFILGMVSTRASTLGVVAGIMVSCILNAYLTCSHFGWLIPEKWQPSVHPYLIGAISNTVLIMVGYLVSLFSRRTRQREGISRLTIWTIADTHTNAPRTPETKCFSDSDGK